MKFKEKVMVMKNFYIHAAITAFVCIFYIGTFYGMERGKQPPPSPEFWKAVIADNTEQIKQLYDREKCNLNVIDTDYVNLTPLIHAVHNGNIQLVQFFLNKGADINLAAPNGFTALMYVAPWGQRESNIPIMKLLLRHKANQNAVARNGFTALKMAVQNDSRLVPLLLSAGVNSYLKNDALKVAIGDNRPDLIEKLADNTEYSADMLSYAARHGDANEKKILTIAAQKNVARNVWEKLQTQNIGDSDIQAIVNKQFGK
jgi:ankyrin repeat protein